MPQPFLAAFAGTAVEFFETVVIAYAILRAGFPREAVSAVVAGHVLVFALAAFALPVFEIVPVGWLRLAAAALLTATGLYWVQKSVRRLIAHKRPRWAEDPLGKLDIAAGAVPGAKFSPWVFLVMGKSSAVEAAEILLVVLPVGAATAAWPEIILGVAVAIAAVSVLAFLLHGQLKKVPEVRLKLAAGAVLSALGISWLWEIHAEG